MMESSLQALSRVGVAFVLVGCGLVCHAPHASAQVATTTDMLSAATTTPAVVVSAPMLPVMLAPFHLGMEYSQTLKDESMTDTNVRWSVVAGTLPSGVMLDPVRGWLHGTPESMGQSSFLIRVTRANQALEERMYSVTVGLSGVDEASSMAPMSSSTAVTLPPVVILGVDVVPVISATDTPRTSPNIIPNWNTPHELLLENLADLEVQVETLVRAMSKDASGVNDHPYADVYYIGTDAKRHAFPSEGVYRSWYESNQRIVEIPAWKLANIPLGRNVTFKPGKKLVHVPSETRPYVVGLKRTLRPLASEAVAPLVYGEAWKSVLEHLPETSIADYAWSTEGAIHTADDFNPTTLQTGYTTPSHEIAD